MQVEFGQIDQVEVSSGVEALSRVRADPSKSAAVVPHAALNQRGVKRSSDGSSVAGPEFDVLSANMQSGRGKTRCLILQRNKASTSEPLSPRTTQNIQQNGFAGGYLQRPSGRDHTLVALSITNQPGSLAKVLNLLNDHGVNMIELSSHVPVESSEIVQFLVKFQGHAEETPCVSALKDLATFCNQSGGGLHVLGSYYFDDGGFVNAQVTLPDEATGSAAKA